jgi:CRISPR-associated exonuclease Cas4
VSEHVPLSDLARAAYCRRQLYYARRDEERGPPPDDGRRALADRYADLRDAADARLRALPVVPDPSTYRERLARLTDRPEWPELAAPSGRRVLVEGRDCRGIAHKLLAGDPPVPTLVSPGEPPERGVWRPQRVRAVGTAKALAWERDETIPRALVEYPAHGLVRTVRLTTGAKAAYRATLRSVRRSEGVPPRTDDRGKCDACAYAEECGGRTRSLRSILF